MNQAFVTHSDAPNREPSLLPLRTDCRCLGLGLLCSGSRRSGLLLRRVGGGGSICGSGLCGSLGFGGGPEGLRHISLC